MLNYIVLSLFMAMVAHCTPVFRDPAINATENLFSGRFSRINRQRGAPKSNRHKIRPTASELLDGRAVDNDGWSQYEPNFLQGQVEGTLNLNNLIDKKDLSQRRQPYAQRSRSGLTVNNVPVSGKPSMYLSHNEFPDGFVFDVSNEGKLAHYSERLVETMNAFRYSPIRDEEDSQLGSTKKSAAGTIDYLDVLKAEKHRPNDRQSGSKFRRQKRAEAIVFADSYYPETAEEIVNRVLLQKQREQQEANDDYDSDNRLKGDDDSMNPGISISYLSSIASRSLQDIQKTLLPMLNSTRNFLSNKPTNGTVSAKAFVYDLPFLSKQYQLYYECLKLKRDWYLYTLGRPMENIEQLLVSSSEQVVLKCHTCLPPLTNARNYGVRWMRRLLAKGGFDEVPSNEEEEENFAMDDDGSLHIQGLSIEDAGMYTCFKNSAQEMTYFIGVENPTDRRRVYESGNRKADETPAKPVVLRDRNLYLYTQWSDWSQCNMCNKRGQRKRVGLCMVRKLVINVPTLPKAAKILNRYPKGVPCRSALLPPFIYEVTSLRLSEYMIGYCFMECSTLQPITYVTDRNGKTVEIVATGKGRKSLRGTPPPLPKELQRITRYADSDKPITLRCPIEENEKQMPIRWQNASQILDEMTLADMTRGRVYIDYDNKLVIRSAKRYDRGVYSCWINLVRVAIIRLMVSAPTDVTLLGVISGFCFVFFVFMMVYLGVHLAKMSKFEPVDKVFRHHAKLGKRR